MVKIYEILTFVFTQFTQILRNKLKNLATYLDSFSLNMDNFYLHSDEKDYIF